MIKSKAETGSLLTGGIAAVFASACCVGPLVLVGTGLGGAWLAYLTVFEPYRWIFIGIASAALAFAGWKISAALRLTMKKMLVLSWVAAALVATAALADSRTVTLSVPGIT